MAETVAPAGTGGVRSLYVHVPFCERKCEYCDFVSVAGLRHHAEYVDALRAELRAIAEALPGVELDTVFVGGGTPSLLPPPLLASVLDEIRACFTLRPAAEVTIEANPSSTSEGRATAWLDAGVTRVSIGVQSLEADVLAFLGRVHDREQALGAVRAVRSAGVEQVSTDLIYAVPGLDDDRWRDTLERVLDLGCGHLSCYELTVEEGTPLHRAVRNQVVRVVDAEVALRQHWMAVDQARAAGLHQYEVSNLARPGHECRHNLAYWDNAHYLAAGVGAHGHLPPGAAAALGVADTGAEGVAVRYWHGRDPERYVAAVRSGELGVSGWEVVDASEAQAERVMLGLRRGRGVALEAGAVPEAVELAEAGLLSWDGVTARVTRRGQEVLNEVAARLVAANERTFPGQLGDGPVVNR